MRIIAGTFRGRRLATVRDHSVRPTTDRVKQALFDALAVRFTFEGSAVLDLFAGSGSLGLEALSRGATHATFIEHSPPVLGILEENIRTLGCTDRTTVLRTDVIRYLRESRRTFDLVFIDPPYKLPEIGTLPMLAYSSGAVRDGGIVVMEHSRETIVTLDETAYDIVRKGFGQTTALILTARPRTATPPIPQGTAT
ncbi:MAG: 16S rRNA (guanine(966)-N(2))-methyltransferase RsmD [Bacteroidota bacterium]